MHCLTRTRLHTHTQRIRELEEEAEEHRADINRLTLLERDARNEVSTQARPDLLNGVP